MERVKAIEPVNISPPTPAGRFRNLPAVRGLEADARLRSRRFVGTGV